MNNIRKDIDNIFNDTNGKKFSRKPNGLEIFFGNSLKDEYIDANLPNTLNYWIVEKYKGRLDVSSFLKDLKLDSQVSEKDFSEVLKGNKSVGYKLGHFLARHITQDLNITTTSFLNKLRYFREETSPSLDIKHFPKGLEIRVGGNGTASEKRISFPYKTEDNLLEQRKIILDKLTTSFLKIISLNGKDKPSQENHEFILDKISLALDGSSYRTAINKYKLLGYMPFGREINREILCDDLGKLCSSDNESRFNENRELFKNFYSQVNSINLHQIKKDNLINIDINWAYRIIRKNSGVKDTDTHKNKAWDYTSTGGKDSIPRRGLFHLRLKLLEDFNTDKIALNFLKDWGKSLNIFNDKPVAKQSFQEYLANTIVNHGHDNSSFVPEIIEPNISRWVRGKRIPLLKYFEKFIEKFSSFPREKQNITDEEIKNLSEKLLEKRISLGSLGGKQIKLLKEFLGSLENKEKNLLNIKRRDLSDSERKIHDSSDFSYITREDLSPDEKKIYDKLKAKNGTTLCEISKDRVLRNPEEYKNK